MAGHADFIDAGGVVGIVDLENQRDAVARKGRRRRRLEMFAAAIILSFKCIACQPPCDDVVARQRQYGGVRIADVDLGSRPRIIA